MAGLVRRLVRRLLMSLDTRRCADLDRALIAVCAERDALRAELAQECRVRDELAAEVWVAAPGRTHYRCRPASLLRPVSAVLDEIDDLLAADAVDTVRGTR